MQSLPVWPMYISNRSLVLWLVRQACRYEAQPLHRPIFPRNPEDQRSSYISLRHRSCTVNAHGELSTRLVQLDHDYRLRA